MLMENRNKKKLHLGAKILRFMHGFFITDIVYELFENPCYILLFLFSNIW